MTVKEGTNIEIPGVVEIEEEFTGHISILGPQDQLPNLLILLGLASAAIVKKKKFTVALQ